MSQSVCIAIDDTSCAATMAQACEAYGISVSTEGSLVVTDDASEIDTDKRIIFLGKAEPDTCAAQFAFPVPLADIIVRIQQLLEHTDTLLSHGDVTMDIYQRRLSKGSVYEELTDKETQLLSMLIGAAGEVVAKDTLLHDVWGYQSDLETHTLETHIYRVRGKLEQLKSTHTIEAKDGGYCLV